MLENQRCYRLIFCINVNLSENRIKKVPLHFVESNSPKLIVKYCATIKQYALNADAYDYWYEKERELNESGNIYTIQPSQPKSNIHNISNPDELVMGFFWVASCAAKRVFVKNPAHSPKGLSRVGSSEPIVNQLISTILQIVLYFALTSIC